VAGDVEGRSRPAWRGAPTAGGGAQSKGGGEGLAEAFIKHKRTNKHRRTDVTEREINRHLVSRWGKRQALEIKSEDVKRMVRELVSEGKARTAHDMFTHARAIFTWGIKEESYGLDSSPCKDKPNQIKEAKKSRERALQDHELAAYWRAAKRMPYPLGPFYRTLLLTGQRLNEVAGMHWRELHPELVQLIRSEETMDWSAVPNGIKVWTLPAERYKTNKEQKVYLPNAVCEVLASVKVFVVADQGKFTSVNRRIPGSKVGGKQPAVELFAGERARSPSPTRMGYVESWSMCLRKKTRAATSAFPWKFHSTSNKHGLGAIRPPRRSAHKSPSY
jgi:hypothetical protein